MKVNGTYVTALLEKANKFLIQHGKTFEVLNFSTDSRKVADFGKEAFVQDICSSLDGFEFKNSRKELLEGLLETYTDDELNELSAALNDSFATNTYPVGEWFGLNNRITPSLTKKELVASQLLIEDLPEFIGIEDMNKDKKENEFKELFAPIFVLGKTFAKTGDESIASIVKAAALESKHEKIKKLAVVFADFFRKGLFHCIRSFELKDFLKTLEDDEVKFPKISEEKRRASIKYLSTFLSILNKYMSEDDKTGFWTLNQEFEGKVTYFKVDIEEGTLLNSPKILRVAAIDVNHHKDIQQTDEQKGEYNKVEEKEPVANDPEQVVGSEEQEQSGGFAPGFHLAQTKHEKEINQKHNDDLIESLRKCGVDLGSNGLKGIDLKALFKMENKKRELGMDQNAQKQAKKSSSDSPGQTVSSASSTFSTKYASAIGPASSATSKPGIASTASSKSGTSSSASFMSSPSNDTLSTPMKTKKGKFFKKLKSSPKNTPSGKKYCHVQASVPIKNEHNDVFEVVLGVTAINELNRGEDKHMFEYRAPVFLKSLQACYSTWDEDEYKFEVGSMSSMTERILESQSYSGRIRAHPGLLNNDFVSFRTYAKYQAILRVKLESTNQQTANNEVPQLIEELQNILASPDWFLCYQIAAYWEYVCPENTLNIDDVLNELWEKAAGTEDNPSFAYIKNGLTKVFRDAMQRARGGLYGAMITDARNHLSQELGNNPIVSKIGLKLDEFLLDEDIAAFATHFFRGYTRESAQVLFKTEFDDQHVKRVAQQLKKLSKKKRNKRILESTSQHHEIVDCVEQRSAKRILEYRKKKIDTKPTLFYEKVYELYLEYATYGEAKFFLNEKLDPLMQSTWTEMKKKLDEMMEDLSDKKEDCEPKIAISDETRHLFSKSCRSRQHEILQMIAFEARNLSMKQRKCKICNGIFISNDFKGGNSKKCSTCEKNKRNKKDLFNMFPVWYDNDDEIDSDEKRKNAHYDLPEELRDLTITEKMLIQTQSFLIPCIHIGKGKFGLCGHTVMFKRDIASVCSLLPRSELDYIEIKRLSVNKDQQTYDTFKVRRKKVLGALRWLKKHNRFYRDIQIVEENLDWMKGKEEAQFTNFKENQTLSDNYNNSTVARKQTQNPMEEKTMEMCGIAIDRADSLFTPESKEVIDDLANATATTETPTAIMWPETDEIPVDEYTEENCFAKCYPWLFPGGYGDVSHNVMSERSKAIEWTSLLLSWEDGRFEHDPCFTFHAFNFIQRHVNNGASLALLNSMFSERKTVDDIKSEIENGNFSTVGKIQNFAAQKIRGSDGWWRSRKHELDSWVAHHLDRGHGPPTLFMTFSCAEYWWDDLLQFLKQRIRNTEDEHLLKSLEQGDEKTVRKIQAKLVDKYTASVQVFFQQKLDNWLETIGKNIFNINHYYLRFEFAKGRGQIHAHMVAITADKELLTEFYETYCVQSKEELGAALLEEYVSNVLSLTEEIEFDATELESEKQKLGINSESSDSSSPLSTNFSSGTNHNLDMIQLCYDVHMHDCSDYCLGPRTSNGKARTCRMGAGKETIPNDPTSTPGFDCPIEHASIEKDYKKDIHILKLKRNNSRLKKTSTSMLESWRANCDVSVIVYATDPNNIVPADIARINGYITSYCTKGNLSFQEERTSIASIISTYDYCGVKSERMNMNAVLQKSMNSLLTSRIVSKPEASVELMGCDLYWCTESAKHINLTGLQTLLKKKKKMTDPIQKYKFRHDTQKHLTFVEYMELLEKGTDSRAKKDARLRKNDPKDKQRYLHPVGFNSSPIFPPTTHYAIATLVLHKKWDNENRLDFELKKKTPIDEFYHFLESADCPQSVKLQFCIAKHRFERKLYRSANNDAHNHDLDELDEEKSNLYNLVSHARFDKSTFGNFYKGDDGYDFNKIHYDFDPNNESGPTWLDETIDAMLTKEASQKKEYINSSTNKPFVISDIGDNTEQNEITFKVLQKIKEWMEFPEVHAHDPSKKFEPLILTVRGAGGTGKSFLVKVIVNAIESMFNVNVTETCAPTGCAAYNIFGKTIHSLFCIDVDDPTKEISQYKKDKLFSLLRHVLLLVIDERSMLGLDLLNAISKNCSEFAHGTGNSEEIFGGIPVVLILGDDSQLPPVKKLGAFDLFTKKGFRNELLTGSDLRGANILESTVRNVKTLRQIKRIVPGQEMLQEINETLRTKPGLTREQCMTLCELNLDNKNISEERRLQIKEKALYVYTTKEEVFKHNEEELRKIVNKTNPLMQFPYQLHKTPKSKLDKPIKSHFKLNTLIEAMTVLTRGARVSLTTNKIPLKGLYNGSLGTVIDIRFAKGESPLLGNLPLVVIVDFDNYSGPPWDVRNPSYVPVPVQTLLEDRSKTYLKCCEMRYVPLEIAFARTLHKVQGQSIGDGHPIPIMVFNPGTTAFEGNNPGLLYTGISRATSLGNNDVNTSAIYFNYASKFELYTRIREIHHKRKSIKRKLESNATNEFEEPQLTNEIYIKVKKRKFWTMFLDQKEALTNIQTTEEERTHILQWLAQKQNEVLSQQELYEIVRFHSKRYKTK